MRKAYLPGTYVPGATPVLHPLTGNPVLDVHNVPIWNKAKPMGVVLHFTNGAAKRRTIEKIESQGKSISDLTKAGLSLATFADPKDVRRVPLYRGLPARLANELRFQMRRRAAA